MGFFTSRRPSTILSVATMLNREAVEKFKTDMASMPEVSPPATTVGSLVTKLDATYQRNLTRRTNLETEIASMQEELRQTNTVIASLEAALTAAADDPALTAEERETAYHAANARFDALPIEEELARCVPRMA